MVTARKGYQRHDMSGNCKSFWIEEREFSVADYPRRPSVFDPARAPPDSLASETLVSTAAWAGTRSSAVS